MKTCGNCGVFEGCIHEPGCDMEICPFCGGQLVSCGCMYVQLGFRYNFFEHQCGLPKEIYENGLPENLKEKWKTILNNKGRIPYIQYPVICQKCGELWPSFFTVPDEEWEYYIEPSMRQSVICQKCYDRIKLLIDAGAVFNNFSFLTKLLDSP